jgi:hypothetical protein
MTETATNGEAPATQPGAEAGLNGAEPEPVREAEQAPVSPPNPEV